MPFDLSIYFVADPECCGGRSVIDVVIEAAEAGVTMVQYRDKSDDMARISANAAMLAELLKGYDIPLIINDHVDVAVAASADGVHLGQGDGDVRDAREELGREAQIGVTCHASRHLAMEAGEGGADYVAFGAFFDSTTKASEHRPEPEILEWWSTVFEIPCVAIGGITPANCAPIVAAGADFLAVSGAVWNGDEVAAVKAFAQRIGAEQNGAA